MTQNQPVKPYWTVEKVIGVGVILTVLLVGSFATVWYITRPTSTLSSTSTQPSNSNHSFLLADFVPYTKTQAISDRVVLFNATVTGNRQSYSLQWWFGDGGIGANQFVIANSTTTTGHNYGSSGGRYTVTLTVTPSISDPSCINSMCPAFTVTKTIGVTSDFVIVTGTINRFFSKTAGNLQSLTFKGNSCSWIPYNFRPGCGQERYFGQTFTATIETNSLFLVALPNGVNYSVFEDWYNSTTHTQTTTQAGLGVYTPDPILTPYPLF